jgi:hypothetical protein
MTEQSTAMAVVRAAAGLSPDRWPDERIDAVKRMYAPIAKNVHEVAAFLATADRYDLDPVLGEVWLAEIKGKLRVMTGRDAMLKAARRDAGFTGIVSGVVYKNDEFRVIREGEAVTVRHLINGMLDRGEIAGAFCVAYHRDRAPVIVIRRWDQYKHLHGRDTWKDYGEDMLETRAITAALRRQYQLAGLYHETEFGSEPAATKTAGAVADLNDALAGEIVDGEIVPDDEGAAGEEHEDRSPADVLGDSIMALAVAVDEERNRTGIDLDRRPALSDAADLVGNPDADMVALERYQRKLRGRLGELRALPDRALDYDGTTPAPTLDEANAAMGELPFDEAGA